MSLLWLDFSNKFQDVFLRDHQRAYSALQLLPRPETQKPQLIALIGGKAKNLFIEKCFSLKSSMLHNKILLRTVPNQSESDAPLFLADCELHNEAKVPTSTTENISSVENYALKWVRSIPRTIDENTLAHLVYTHLLIPFSTILCIFASDFNGTEKVARFLASWLRPLRNRPQGFPSTTYTRLLIFVDSGKTFDEKLATVEFLKHLRFMVREMKGLTGPLADETLTDVEFGELLKSNAFEIHVLPLPPGNESYFKTLRKRVLCESEEIHSFRTVNKRAFSARHFQFFFQSACRHFAENIISPFDFVRASRIPNPLPQEIGTYLAHFSDIMRKHEDILVGAIASALCLESFPPGAHIFDPGLIFDVLYFDILTDALRELSNHRLIVENIKVDFCKFRDYINTAWVHKQHLQRSSELWKTTFSNSTCLSCCVRTPSSTLPCKHSLCDTCIVIYGKSDLEEPWNFKFESCLLCNTPMEVSFLLKPYTAGIRCMVLDGGVYNDYEELEIIQRRLLLPIDILEYFDIVNGSGIGGWIILEELYKHDKSTEDNFEQIRNELQSPTEQPVSRFSTSTRSSLEATLPLKQLGSALKAVPRWSGTLQSTLKILSNINAIFGETTLLDCYLGSTKLCMTLIRPKDQTTCIISNYNGDMKRPSNYIHVREQKTKNEMLLAQCARLSISAKIVNGYNAKQRKNPDEMINITDTEQRIIWEREDRPPEILIALGDSIHHLPKEPPDWLVDFRLHDRFYDEILDNCVDALLSALFYIELIGLPQLDELGKLLCRAQVRCRILPSSSAYPVLIQRLRDERARFYFDYQSIPCVNKQLIDEAGRKIAFSRCINVSMLTLECNIDIKIHGITKTSRSISNCPYKVQQLIEDQKLTCVFGNKDHKTRYFGSIYDSGQFF